MTEKRTATRSCSLSVALSEMTNQEKAKKTQEHSQEWLCHKGKRTQEGYLLR
jgi:hypothetical protein